MQHLALNIIFILSIAATCFVITMSIVLVIRKGIEVRTNKVRDRLFKKYSFVFANILMQENSDITSGTRRGERYRYYESTLIEQKKRMKRMASRTRMLHTSVIRSVLIDYSKDLRGETTERIIYYIYSLRILDEPIKMMESSCWWVRAAAAKELGLLNAKRSIVPLTAALEDVHPDVQFQAMQSLLMIVGVSALRNILRLSKSFSQWTAVELSVIVLEYREEAAEYLLESLSFPSPTIVLFSITMLAQIGIVRAVEPLIQFCSSNPKPILCATAIEALGRLGDERALPLLLRNSQNSNMNIRLSALQALGRLGASEGIGTATECFQRGDVHEMRIAAQALGSMGDKGYRTLHELSKSADETNRRIALEVIEELERGR